MNTRRIRTLTMISMIATLSIAAPLSAQQTQPMTEAKVKQALESQGYTNVNDVEFSDGMWKADARSADGNRVEVSIDQATGTLYPSNQVAKLSEKDVRAALAGEGYSNVHDVDYDDGVWNAEANDAAGKKVELKIDPGTGKVIGKSND